MMTKDIVYFARAGAGNTEGVIQAVQKRAQELRIEHVVIASDSGETTLKFWEALQGTGVKLVSVCEHAGYDGGDEISIREEARKDPESKGIKVLVASHALSGVSRSISKKFGGITPVEVIAHTLRLFGGGGGRWPWRYRSWPPMPDSFPRTGRSSPWEEAVRARTRPSS